MMGVFECKILRRIYGPIKESDGNWRIRSNLELYQLMHHENIIKYVKSEIVMDGNVGKEGGK